MRCAQRSMHCSARSTTATLSGLLPDRPKCTIRVGVRRLSVLAGLATMSVVATASARSAPARANAGARHSPMNEELPAPVRTMRSAGSARSGARKGRSAASPAMSCTISGQTCGCCAISRTVAAAPPASICPAVSPSASMDSLLSLRSVVIRDAEDVGASVGAVAGAGAAQALPDALSGRPGKQWVAVEVAARDRVREVPPLGIDLETAPMVVQARRDPVEGVGDGGPPRHFGALGARYLEARLVVPVDVRSPGSLLIEESDRERGRRRGIDGTGKVAELIVAAGTGGRELHACPEAIIHDVLPGELDTRVGALGAIGRSRHGPQERDRRIGR